MISVGQLVEQFVIRKRLANLQVDLMSSKNADGTECGTSSACTHRFAGRAGSAPVGYEWVRDGSDALLITTGNGEILQVEYGVFAL